MNRQILIISAVICLLSIVLSWYIPVITVVIFFVVGGLTCFTFFNPKTVLPNLLVFTARKDEVEKIPYESLKVRRFCAVCGKHDCSRHRPELNFMALQPWTSLKIPQKVDKALEEIFNLVLKDFVYTWYRDLSQDESFVDELRSSIRFAVSVLLRRLSKVDIPSVITNQILRTAMRHLHFYLHVRKKIPADGDLEVAVLEFYGRSLHGAARNRRAELDYLRDIVDRLCPFVLPQHSLKCKSVCVILREILAAAVILPALDVLADPDIVNNIILVLLDDSPSIECHDPQSPMVPLLATFSQPQTKSNSCLHLDLSDILQTPEILYPFMQFMKAEASVNVLQFYLTVEEFNSRVLQPELNVVALEDLHVELQELFKMYCDPAAHDRIHFDDDIVSLLKSICDGPPEGILKLQTTTPLFRAYDHAYDLLENTFLPLFHQSDDYYRMLCGERLPTGMQRSSSRASKRSGEAFAFSKIGNKIKGVFKPQPVDGKFDDVDFAVEEADAMSAASGCSTSSEPLLDIPDMCNNVSQPNLANQWWQDGPLKDLSAWRVTIPCLVPKTQGLQSKKVLYVYQVQVRRVDVLENDFEASNWTVERRYEEFYLLEQRLKEFHGEFDDAQLPPKKSFGTKSKEYLDSKKQAFEQYLQHLLYKPTLKGSELLYKFFTAQYDFSANFSSDINFSKIVKSGAMKLVKERGQHLDPFLQSFLNCTESSKSRPSRWSDKDSDTISISSEKMASSLFENNANVELNLEEEDVYYTKANLKSLEYVKIQGVFDTVMYLAENVYNSPSWFLQLLLTLRILIRNTFDSYLNWFIDLKLKKVMQEHRATRIIHLIRDVLFFDNDPPRTEEDKLNRKEEALKTLKNEIPKIFAKAVGNQNFDSGTNLVFGALQHPKLNKQLSYMLLDEVLKEVFPELVQDGTKRPIKTLDEEYALAAAMQH